MMRNVLIVLVAITLMSAKSDDFFQKGNSYKAERNFGMALEMYNNALTESIKEGDNVRTKEVTKQLGMVHYQLKNYLKSEWYFDQLVYDEDCDTDVLFKYARLQQINSRLDRAKIFYDKWAVKKGNSALAKPFKDYCDLIKKGEAGDNSIEVFPMAFNTADYAEYSPVVHDGKLVFTSNKPAKGSLKDNTGRYFTDLMESDNLDYRGDKKTNLFSGSLKTVYNESSACFTNDGNTIYFTGNNVTPLKSVNEVVTYSLGIFKSEFDGYKWSKPELLSFISPGFNYAFPAISDDGNTMIFASDILNGMGGMDLYKSEFIEGKWGMPVNLGDNINTEENDVYPFLLESGNETTLFYSTEGKPGYGGLDIFSSKMVGGAPQLSEILLSPVNSSYDDFGYWATTSNTFGYISSNRSGSDDIFYFKTTDNIISTVSKPKVVLAPADEEEYPKEPEKPKAEPKPKTKPKPKKEEITKKEEVPDEKIAPVAEVETKEEIKKEPMEKPLPPKKVKPEKKVVTEEPETPKKETPIKETPKKETPKKDPPKTVTPKRTIDVSRMKVLEPNEMIGYYIILHSSNTLEDAAIYRADNYSDAVILHNTPTKNYLVAYHISDERDDAKLKFVQKKEKYKGGWFFDTGR